MTQEIDISGDDLPTLRKQFKAMAKVLRAKEAQVEHMHAELTQLRASTNPELLASEREANARLTQELEQAEKDAAKWRWMTAEIDPKQATQLDAAVTMTMFMRKYVAGQGEGA